MTTFQTRWPKPRDRSCRVGRIAWSSPSSEFVRSADLAASSPAEIVALRVSVAHRRLTPWRPIAALTVLAGHGRASFALECRPARRNFKQLMVRLRSRRRFSLLTNPLRQPEPPALDTYQPGCFNTADMESPLSAGMTA